MKKGKTGKKRFRAFIGDGCTGCGSSPVCRALCPVDGALEYIPDEDAFPFRRMRVNPDKCIGCGVCVSKGYEGAIMEGCPWKAITLIPVEDQEEARVDSLPGQAS